MGNTHAGELHVYIMYMYTIPHPKHPPEWRKLIIIPVQILPLNHSSIKKVLPQESLTVSTP
jgi:hypothetical protein